MDMKFMDVVLLNELGRFNILDIFFTIKEKINEHFII
jgi:hypothetical protein